MSSSVARYWSLATCPIAKLDIMDRGVCTTKSRNKNNSAALKTDRADLYSPPARRRGVRHVFSLSRRRQASRRWRKGEKFRNGRNLKNVAVVNPLAKQFLIGAAKQMKLEENLTLAARDCAIFKIVYRDCESVLNIAWIAVFITFAISDLYFELRFLYYVNAINHMRQFKLIFNFKTILILI